MAAVTGGNGWSVPERPTPSSEAARAGNDAEAARLLAHLRATAPPADGFDEFKGMPCGADIQLQPGPWTRSLIGPGVWPTASESEFEQHGENLKRLGERHENANQTAKHESDQVFSDYWTFGDGATGAQVHYRREWQGQAALAAAHRALGDAYCSAAENIRTAKRKIRAAHDEAHREIEATLCENAGRGVNVGHILSRYRSLIEDWAAELRGYAEEDKDNFFKNAGFTLLDNHNTFKQAGDGKDGSRGQDAWPDPEFGASTPETEGAGIGRGKNALGGGSPTVPGPSGNTVPSVLDDDRGKDPFSPVAPLPTRAPGLPVFPAPPKPPSLPSISGGGTPGLGGGGLNSLSGVFGRGVPTPTASPLPTPAVQSQATQAVGEQFSRGFSAGSGIASAASLNQPVPQDPSGPLAASPVMAAPSAAVPAAAAPPAVAATPGPAPAVTEGAGGGGAPLTPFGSVLPPPATPSVAAAAAAGAASMSGPAVPPPAATAAAIPGAASGFVPVRDAPAARPSRDVSFSDLELARSVVADLIAASSVAHPGLQWAVGVGRGSNGTPDLWIATNEGAGYIPSGVFVPRTMALAAGFDPEFDTRWFGWNHPAETVWRALLAQGLTVSAVATSWGVESEALCAAVVDVAFGVPPVGGPNDADASRFTRGRSHRLETVAPALYHELGRVDAAAVDAYCREVTGQAAFHAGAELSATAQTVARELVSGWWPSAKLWAALHSEYTTAQMMAGAQRPGAAGVEDAQQMLRYHGEFLACRRMETLLAWEGGKPADVAFSADVVYAARAAGVAPPFDAGL